MVSFSKKVYSTSFVIFLVSAIVGSWLYISFFTIQSSIVLSIKDGYNKNNIAGILKRNKAIKNSTLFKMSWKFKKIISNCDNIHIGDYKLQKHESLFSAINKFCKGQSIMDTITIPEGLYSFQVLEIVNKNTKLNGKNVVGIDEGILLPETYTFKTGITKQSIIEKMQEDMKIFLYQEWEKRDKDIPLKTPYEALIFASIVEAEAKNDNERATIAGVYMNRLKKRMRLQADPTAIYEITKGKYKMKRMLTRKDLKIKGEYNTYTIYGLPKTPICNAGKKSIIATLHPEKNDFLFFVANNDLSGHIFSSSFKDHSANIKNVKKQKEGSY